MPTPKRRLPPRRTRGSDPHADLRRAVSSLYERVGSRGATLEELIPDSAPWRLVVELTIEGERFVVACRDSGSRAARLTPREREVVALAGEGESNKAIGYRLGISPSTVGVLLWRATSKLGVRSREELLRSAHGG